MSEELEEIKKDIQKSLEKSFIENKSSVEKEMKLLNLLITVYSDSEYTYDEYCKNRMEFELEACDKALNINFEKELDLTPQERTIINDRASSEYMINPGVDFEEILKEEYVKWQTEKCFRIDKKMYYQIFKYSNMKLLESKIPEEIWIEKKVYFNNICEDKAIRSSELIATANKKDNEEDIRSSFI